MTQPTSFIPRESIEAQILNALQKSIAAQLQTITDGIVADAKQEFETKVRAAIGQAAVSLLATYSMERNALELTIRVKLESK